MSRLPSVLSADDLPLPELHAACLDGELFRVGDCFSPIDEVDERRLRATSLSRRYSDRLIGEQYTAAWVLGAVDSPPARRQFCVDIAARFRLPSSDEAALREVVITEEEIWRLPEFAVTSPLRTAVDLVRFSPVFGERERSVIEDLLRLGGLTIDDCIAAIRDRHNLPGKRAALERISRR